MLNNNSAGGANRCSTDDEMKNNGQLYYWLTMARPHLKVQIVIAKEKYKLHDVSQQASDDLIINNS